ncbi:cupin domain-containing protein [Modestobacter sp. L9-4]|nr:cupin domain-containing protein [Modestobacter sp. L9-4]
MTVVRAGAGELIEAAGVEHLFQLTGGRLGVERFVVPPSTVGARPHVHGSHDEYFYVLAGTLTLATEDGETALTAGDLAAAPRGSVHGYRNASPRGPGHGAVPVHPARLRAVLPRRARGRVRRARGRGRRRRGHPGAAGRAAQPVRHREPLTGAPDAAGVAQRKRNSPAGAQGPPR